MDNLEVNFIGEKFKNPILLASGTCGVAGREFEPYFNLSELGGIVTKSLSIKPRVGNATPRIAEVSYGCGMLNSIGLQNPGIDYFLSEELPYLKTKNTKIILNIVGESLDDYLNAVEKIKDKKEISFIELNLSCPNVDGGLDFAQDPQKAFLLVSKVKNITSIPILTKLSPNVTDIIPIAKACIEAGVNGLSLINTVLGLVIDYKKRKPILPRAVGGYSGPGIKPIALRMIWQIRKNFKDIPIIGIGGIHSFTDALEFFLCGANLVQIGTANFKNPNTCIEIIKDLKNYLEENKINSIEEIINQAHDLNSIELTQQAIQLNNSLH